MKKLVVRNSIAPQSCAFDPRTRRHGLRIGLTSAALLTLAAPAFADPPSTGTPPVAPSAGSPATSPAAGTPAAPAPGADSTSAPTLAASTSGVPSASLNDPSAPAPVATTNDQPRPSTSTPASDVRDDVPVLALTHAAFGSRSGKWGAHGFGYGTGASSGSVGGGGLTLYGSPLNRLTLLLTGERHADGRFAPHASIAYRILGSVEDGWALAAMGTYKAEGFAEVEGEVELGAMFSLMRDRWHLDFNAVAGGGFEESEEADAEAKLRMGYDVADWFRLGLDSRARYRLRGDKLLAGGRKGDFIGGPQAIVSWSQFYGSVLAGVSTVDVSSNVGAAGWLTVGGMLP